ncbi:MAG TPA: hypothetical protein VFE15_13190 [Marmoricola sp.]|jgi:hypothetical protein|nr:hypothetical protein [Marmoricola sp.]
MMEGITVGAPGTTNPHAVIPTPRVSPENAGNRHRAPTLAELIDNASSLIRRDSLAPSGFLVVQKSHSTAKHQHAVWQLGPFALLDDGWFGQVHGRDASGVKPSRWLAKHERKCTSQHWTQFQWIDPGLLDAGCGAANIGLGLSPDGPTYCPGPRLGEPHPTHVPLVQIFRDGLRMLALEPRR